MHRTDLFILNRADLEYTEKNFMVADAVLWVSKLQEKIDWILKRTKIKIRITINHGNKKVS